MRVDKNPIPLGSYRYYVACTYNSVRNYYYSDWEDFKVEEACSGLTLNSEKYWGESYVDTTFYGTG